MTDPSDKEISGLKRGRDNFLCICELPLSDLGSVFSCFRDLRLLLKRCVVFLHVLKLPLLSVLLISCSVIFQE